MDMLNLENAHEHLGEPGIYYIKISNKNYVGSSASIGHRLKHHIWSLQTKRHHNRTMQNCWNKHQKAEFKILEKCDVDCLIDREKFYIDTLKPYMNHILDPVNIVRDDVYRKRLSDGLKKAYAEGLEPHNKQAVYMYTLKGIYIKMFSSITEAALTFNADPSGICAVLNGRAKSAQKHLWSTSKMDKLDIPDKEYKKTAVEQCNLDGSFIKEWTSITEAQKMLNISNIARAVKHGRTAGGFKWVSKE